MGSKWNMNNIQEASNKIHNNKFIIHDIRVKEFGKDKRKTSQTKIECKDCGYKTWIIVSNFIKRKGGCSNCSGRVPLSIIELQSINNNVIIHNTELRKVGDRKYGYVNLECKKCKHKDWILTHNFTNSKYGCSKCSDKTWTLEKIRIASKKIHNNKFKIHNLLFKLSGVKQRTHIDLECNDCGHRDLVQTDTHINKESGCNGACKLVGHRKSQIEQLKHNPTLANELAKLYFLKFSNYDEIFYKIGKTIRSIENRFESREYKNYVIEEVKVIEGTHLWVAEQEDKFIETFKDYQYTPKLKFGGHTECFKKEIYNIMFPT